MTKMEMLQDEFIAKAAWMSCSTDLQRKMFTDILHDNTIRFEDTHGNVIDGAELTELSTYLVGIEHPVWQTKSLNFVANTVSNVIRDMDKAGYYCLTNYTEDIYDNGYDCIQDDIDPRDVSIVETIAIYVLARN